MMSFRLLIGTVAAALVYGCAQTSAPLPSAPAQNAVSSFRPLAGAPKLQTQEPLGFFNLPSSGGSWPDFIVAGPQQAMWFTEFFGNFIGRIAMDGTITTFTLPDANDAEGITVDGKGNIWFTEPGANQIGKMTARGKGTLFQINGSNPSPRGITLGPDGNMWYTEYYDGYIGRVTPQGTITRFDTGSTYSSPWAITTGPDGDLWFTESGEDQIGRFNPKTLSFDSSIEVPTQNATPWGILLAPDKHIWFTERTGDKIAEVTSRGSVKEFALSQPGSYPEALAPATDGNLWFTQSQSGTLGNIDPKTGKFGATVTLPANSIPNGIAVGPNKNLWFCIDAYYQTNQVGEVLLH
jgi:streptogramin lyase